MYTNSILLVGCGYVGEFLGTFLLQKGWRVYATTRNSEKIEKFKKLGFSPVLFSHASFDFKKDNITHVVSSIPRKEALRDPGLDFMEKYDFPNLKWAGYLSSTCVYGDHKGDFVDEESLCLSRSLEGYARRASEKEWQDFAKLKNLSLMIFRLAGIYGPYQNILKNIKEGKSHFIHRAGHFMSRIHVDDIVDVLFHSFVLKKGEHIFNGADDVPASHEDVVKYACALMGTPVPIFKNFEDVKSSTSPFLQRLFEDNRKISNKKMKELTQKPLNFSSYKEGLSDIFKKRMW